MGETQLHSSINLLLLKTFEELIEEVYQDSDLREEFISDAQLIKKSIQSVKLSREKSAPSLGGDYLFVNYQEIIRINSSLPSEVVEMQKGIRFLSLSLFKTLAKKYPLPAEEVQILKEAVADKYGKSL